MNVSSPEVANIDNAHVYAKVSFKFTISNNFDNEQDANDWLLANHNFTTIENAVEYIEYNKLHFDISTDKKTKIMTATAFIDVISEQLDKGSIGFDIDTFIELVDDDGNCMVNGKFVKLTLIENTINIVFTKDTDANKEKTPVPVPQMLPEKDDLVEKMDNLAITEKPKRKYTRKPKETIPVETNDANTAETVVAEKPKRKYTRKPKETVAEVVPEKNDEHKDAEVVEEVVAEPVAEKPKRKYTRKPKETVAEVVPEKNEANTVAEVVAEPVAEKPKRKYTRKPKELTETVNDGEELNNKK